MASIRMRRSGRFSDPIMDIPDPADTPDPDENLEAPPTNPAFGEVGWMSARPLEHTSPDWARWYDLYRARGGGNPVSKGEFDALSEASPEGSNQFRGVSAQHMTPMQMDPYYNTPGLGPGYDPRSGVREAILAGRGPDLSDLPNLRDPAQARIARQRRASFKGLQRSVQARPDMRIR